MIAMIVFACPYARLIIGMRFRQSRNINVEPISGVNPSCINNVEPVASLALNGGRIYVKEVGSFHRGVVIGDVVVVGEVEVVTEVAECRARYLGIDVPVPRKHLPIEIMSADRFAGCTLRKSYLPVPPPA